MKVTPGSVCAGQSLRNSRSYSSCVPIQNQRKQSSSKVAKARKPDPARTDQRSCLILLKASDFMLGCFFQGEILARDLLNFWRQAVETRQKSGNERLHGKGVAFPARWPALAFLMSESNFPAWTSAAIFLSQSVSRYSSNQSATA